MRNPDPPEADLPFHLTGEMAAFSILSVAYLVALALSDLFSVGATTLVLGLGGTAALALQQWHLYQVTLSAHKVYRAANMREITSWKSAYSQETRSK